MPALCLPAVSPSGDGLDPVGCDGTPLSLSKEGCQASGSEAEVSVSFQEKLNEQEAGLAGQRSS